MTTLNYQAGAPGDRPGPTAVQRLWRRELQHYPGNASRFTSLGIVVAATIVLYYEFYLSGGVAVAILRDLHMSFLYYVNIAVVGYVLGAGASVIAGLADRYGRANIVTAGLAVTGVLCLVGLPNAHSEIAFAILFGAISFVEGIILVATPALVRDFSPQLGRASAMGFWTLGPVLGSLVVSVFVTTTGDTHTWQWEYGVCGAIGLVIFVAALVGLRELAPNLRDQLMVSSRDRALIEARAKGLDIEAGLRQPFRQMLHLDVIGSAFAISVFLIIYYLAVGFFPVFFETVFGYSQSRANALGNWFWAFDAGALLLIGYVSDRVRVRKPFMIVGAVAAVVFTAIFATRATHPETSYTTFVLLLTAIAVSLGLAYAPWMASFTETVERRNPALTATGLAVWGLVIRVVIAVSVFFVPHVVNTVSTLVDKGGVIATYKASTASTGVGTTTVGDVVTALTAPANKATVATLNSISAKDADLIAALKANPTLAAQLAAGLAAGATPTTAQLAAIRTALGDKAFGELAAGGGADLITLTTKVAPALGVSNFAAISAPNAALTPALAYLAANGTEVGKASSASPKQWRTYFWIAVGGEVVFIPLIFLMAGFWNPRKAREAEEAHEALVVREMAALQDA